MTHTPGPWSLEERPSESMIRARGTVISGYVARVGTGSWALPNQRDEQRANARLIAACPAMLEALKSVAKDLHYGIASKFVEGDAWTAMLARLDAAIAAAEGGE